MSSKNHKVSIQDVAEHPNAACVHWHGDYLSMLCPFHDDREPSLLVYPTYFICKAASCSRRGTLQTLLTQLEHWQTSVEETPMLVVKWAAVLGTEGNPTDQFLAQACAAADHPGVRLWYKRRGLEGLIEKCQLGWWRGWYVTPVFDEGGKCQRVILRAGPTLEGLAPRYVVSPGPAMLYIPDWGLLHTRPRFMFFPFGVYDALTLCKLRLPCATGAGPCTDLSLDLLDEYRRYICIVPDGSPPEEASKALRAVKELGWRGKIVKLNYSVGIKDANDFLQKGKEKDLEKQLARWCYD